MTTSVAPPASRPGAAALPSSTSDFKDSSQRGLLLGVTCKSSSKTPSTPSISVTMKTFLDCALWGAASPVRAGKVRKTDRAAARNDVVEVMVELLLGMK